MIYLAQPYSHPDEQMRQARYEIAMRVCANLMMRGYDVYSPIVHWHEVARQFDMPTDATFWRHHNLKVLSLCSTLAILKSPGWQKSVGLRYEVKEAIRLEKEITQIVNWQTGHQLPLNNLKQLARELNLENISE